MAGKVDPEAVAIGQAVRGALADAGLSLAQASIRSGINLTTLSRRVNGTLPFTFPELVRIAAACEIKVADLAASAEQIAGHPAAGTARDDGVVAAQAEAASSTLV